MFLPFLPHILALFGLSAVMALSDGPATALTGWQLATAYLALPVLGALLGHLPEGLLGSRSPMRLAPRRLLLLGLWLGVLAGLPVYAGLASLLRPLPLAGEAAMGLLLLNHWVSDALALRDITPWARRRAGQWRSLGETLRIPLPIVALFMLGVAFSGAFDGLLAGGAVGGLPVSLKVAAALVAYLLVVAGLVPVLIRACWALRRTGPETERAVVDELGANGVRVHRVFQWPEEAMGSTTAGIIGLLPRFRYMLVGPSIVEAASEAELRSITAHEAAHIRHHHLWYYLAAIFAFILAMQMAVDALLLGTFWIDVRFPFWTLAVLEVVALLAFLRFGMGMLSRRFERQADLNAYARHGCEAFQSALLKVGRLNGIPPQQDNWHHYGITRRISYLIGVQMRPELGRLHQRRVFRAKAAVLGALAVFGLAHTVFPGTDWMPAVAERVVAGRLERIERPTPAEQQAVRVLASRAFQRRELEEAERYFRALVRWNPEAPRAQNNLAWLLLTRPGASQAEVKEGLRLARRASDAEQSAYIWDTLTEAYLRTGQPAKAEAAARRALELAEAGRGVGDSPVEYYRDRLQEVAGGQTG